MKSVIILCSVAALVALNVWRWKNKHPVLPAKNATAKNSAYSPVCILELFTSEGCSSCPPADNLLPSLAKSDSNIIALSFHVDYWDRLGWKDQFSNAEYTERQRQYVEQLHLESAYTPQLVVNGQYELVGSDRATASTTIKKSLQTNASVLIHAKGSESNGKITIDCKLEGELGNKIILAALVQRSATTQVKAGENNGATLSHTNVVRSLMKQNASANNEFLFVVPPGLAKENREVIIYTQDKNSLAITGASKILL